MKHLSEPFRANYHAHTYRCRHAGGTEEDYVRAALESGFSVLGFSDHTPWPYAGDYVSPVRMLPAQLEDYVQTVRELAARYADRIRILCGLECEYYPDRIGWLKEQAERFSLDYLILGHHFSAKGQETLYFGGCREEADVRRYVREVTAGLETGLYAYLAHPDVALQRFREWTPGLADAMRELCRAANALRIPLEYNLLGLIYSRQPDRAGQLGSPCRRFWELAAEEGVTAIVGVDAHRTEHMRQAAEYDAARAYLSGLGIRLTDTLPPGRPV